MTKKLLTAALAIAACAALWGAVWLQNASGGKVPASDQVTSTAAVAQEEHAPAEETSPPLPTEALIPEPALTEPQPPATPAKETATPESKPAQTSDPTVAAPQPAQTSQPEQPQPSADPAPGEQSVAGGKAHVWVPGFGWVDDGGGNVCTYAADLYENGNKIGSMG